MTSNSGLTLRLRLDHCCQEGSNITALQEATQFAHQRHPFLNFLVDGQEELRVGRRIGQADCERHTHSSIQANAQVFCQRLKASLLVVLSCP